MVERGGTAEEAFEREIAQTVMIKCHLFSQDHSKEMVEITVGERCSSESVILRGCSVISRHLASF